MQYVKGYWKTVALPFGLTTLLSVLLLSSFLSHSANILFDEGHRQAFSINKQGKLDLSEFAKVLSLESHDIKALHQPINHKVLTGIDALIISGAFQRYSPQEINDIKTFVEQGGSLVVMIHIAPPVGDLLAALDINVSNYIVHEQRAMLNERSTNFVVSDLSKHPLFDQISSFNIYGAWALKALNGDVTTLAKTSAFAWLDLNRNKIHDQQDHSLRAEVVIQAAHQRGNVLVFADDALFQNQFLSGNNLKLAQNLAKWLSTAKCYINCAELITAKTTSD